MEYVNETGIEDLALWRLANQIVRTMSFTQRDLKEEPRSEDVSVRPVLTIAIPTYNRCDYLQKLLAVLHDQIACEPRVELVISDNASTDKTERS